MWRQPYNLKIIHSFKMPSHCMYVCLGFFGGFFVLCYFCFVFLVCFFVGVFFVCFFI